MRILLIAPLPPPLNGQSLASQAVFEAISTDHEVIVVDMKKPRPVGARDRLGRYFHVLKMVAAVARKQRRADLVYLTLSESGLGNLKDLCFYLLCRRKLQRMVVHLLGGAGMQRILDTPGLRRRLNVYFLRRVGAIVVEGSAQARMFSRHVDGDRIHVVTNFADDALFLSEQQVLAKFDHMRPLKILFLSNLIFGKGHNELADGYAALSEFERSQVRVVFVGGFESETHRQAFMNKIAPYPGLSLGDFVSGDAKKSLFAESHVFCLPTYYPYEGQPFSIIEAYATGCVVITTAHSGIPDVFCDRVNGFQVAKKDAMSITRVIARMLSDGTALPDIALFNRRQAGERHRRSGYCATISRIISDVGR